MAAGRGQSRTDASDFGLDRAGKNHTDRVEHYELGMLADGLGDRFPRRLSDEVGELFDCLAHRELPDSLQRRRDSGGQLDLRDVQCHRYQAVVADRTDEIDDAAFAEGVPDAL